MSRHLLVNKSTYIYNLKHERRSNNNFDNSNGKTFGKHYPQYRTSGNLNMFEIACKSRFTKFFLSKNI